LCRSLALPRAAAVQLPASLPLRLGPPPRISNHRADVRCFAATAAIGVAMPPKSKAKAKAKATQKRPAPKASESKPKKAAKKEEAATPLPAVDVDESKAIPELVGSLTEPGWQAALSGEFEKDYFVEIAKFVQQERSRGPVHPPADQVFSAFNETPLDKVKVVIIGQDPYHEPGQAHGMCFSVVPGVTVPPSLKNVYKELEVDIPGFETPNHGYLLPWAHQGVFLLNATLTVREGHKEANSHSNCGWQRFTDEVIKVLNDQKEGIVFLLWGGNAQKKGKMLDKKRHRVLQTGHPSPLSVKKWRGCKVFSKCNAELEKLGKGKIDWLLPSLPEKMET